MNDELTEFALHPRQQMKQWITSLARNCTEFLYLIPPQRSPTIWEIDRLLKICLPFLSRLRLWPWIATHYLLRFIYIHFRYF